MPRAEDIQHSILIVSGSEQFDAIVRKSLPQSAFMTIDFRKSESAARRCILERYYDMVVVNIPLPDGTGHEFALDVTEQCNASVLVVAPREIYEDVLEHVSDCGVLVLAKPFPRGRLSQEIRFLMAVQGRMHRLEKKILCAEEKLEELQAVSKAKLLLVEKKHMTEDDAHRYIGKQAMNSGVSRKRIAERILEDLEELE